METIELNILYLEVKRVKLASYILIRSSVEENKLIFSNRSHNEITLRENEKKMEKIIQ